MGPIGAKVSGLPAWSAYLNTAGVDTARKRSKSRHHFRGYSRLSNIELLVVSLAFACCHVVDDGETPYMVESVLLANLEARLANNDSDFSLVVNRFCEIGVWVDFISVRDGRSPSFSEDDGMRGHVNFVRAVISARSKESVRFHTPWAFCDTYPDLLNSLAWACNSHCMVQKGQRFELTA